MSVEDFEAAIEDAKRLEGKLMEYQPYDGEIRLEKTLDMDPKDYVDLTFQDLVNEYERDQKILSTRKMGIYAKGEEEAKATAESAEIETRLKEMTTDALKKAEGVAKEPGIEERVPVEAPPIEIEKPEAEIEFETRPAEEIELEKHEEIELEREEIELEKPPAPEIELEKPPAPVMHPPEAKKVIKAVPPALMEAPDEAAARKYQQMEEHIRSVLGEKIDELTMKKKMLELTKQLFKEKSHNKRAEIKLQITVLKNMLVSAQEGMVKKPKTEVTMLQTIISTQQAEVAQSKDKVIDSYKKQIADIRRRFYEDVAATEDMDKKKEIYDAFVFSVTSLIEQLPEVIKKYEDFATEKHIAEIEKLKKSTKNKKTLASAEERIGYIHDNYGREFGSIKRILAKEIETLIDVSGSDIFKKPKEKPTEKDVHEIVKEINETDEGSLLYYLHSKEPDFYRRYERKHISKAEAISHAKAIMAKSKGLSEKDVNKYFSQVE